MRISLQRKSVKALRNSSGSHSVRKQVVMNCSIWVVMRILSEVSTFSWSLLTFLKEISWDFNSAIYEFRNEDSAK